MNAFEWSKLYFRNEDRDLRETKATMAALYSYVDFDTLVCWPSQRTLASVTGLDVRTVRRHISKNIAKKWLAVVEPGVSKSQPNRYQLRTPTPSVELEPRALMPSVEPELRTSLTATEDMRDRQLRSPVSSITNQRTNQGTTHREGTEGTDALGSSDLSSAPFGGSESSHWADDDPWGVSSPSVATTQVTEDTGDLSTEVTDVLVPDFCDSNEDPFASVKYDPYGDDPFAPPHQEARQRLLAAIASEGGAIPARSAQGLAEVPGGEIAAVVESLIADGLVIHDKSSEVDTLRLV